MSDTAGSIPGDPVPPPAVPRAGEGTPKLAVVNGLRGAAILAVVFHHSFGGHFDARAPDGAATWSAIWAHTLDPLLGNGWVGVNLFFVLSGFVLYLPYAHGQRSLEGRGIRAFYRRRFLRLAPLFVLVALISTVFNGPGTILGPSFYAYGAALLSALFPLASRGFMPPANWVLWSVGVEIWFSVLFPVVALAMRRHGAMNVLAGAIVLALAVRVAGYAWFAPSREFINVLSASVIGRLDEFVLGMATAALYRDPACRAWASSAFPVGMVLLGASLFAWSHWRGGSWPVETGALINLATSLGCAMILLGVLHGRPGGVLWSAPLQVTGMMCYSLYVWHVLVLKALLPPGWVLGALPASPAYGTYLALLFAIAALTYRYVEFGGVREGRALFVPEMPPPARAPAVAAARSGA